MRYLLFLLALPLFPQTAFDPSQIRPCTVTTDCLLVSVKGTVTWALADPNTIRIERDPSNQFGWRVVALSPAVDSLTARVSTLEVQVASLVAQQPTVDIFVSTSAGQTFTPSETPKWGYVEVIRNGVVQSAGKDYNFSSGVVTFLGGLPIPNEIIRLQYWK